MNTKQFLITIAACLLIVSLTPMLFSAPAPVTRIALWLIVVGAAAGLLAALVHIVVTRGRLFRGFDWQHEAESPWLRRNRRWCLVLGAGLILLAGGGILLGAWWYPRPDWRGIDPSPESFVIGPMFLASPLLALGTYLLAVTLYRIARVRRVLQEARHQASAPTT